MKLLIVTQVVGTEHPILGFFHRWIEEFAKNCSEVTVICQAEGNHNLPANVKVLSLGKESGASKLKQLFNFYQFIWRERKSYDTVFVHMIPLYVILGGPIWRLLRKKIGLWYTHGTVSFSLRVATALANHIFTASEESFRIKTFKKRVTGHGIDTSVFKPEPGNKTIDLVFVGRIYPVKNIELLIELVSKLNKQHPTSLSIIGSTIDSKGEEYKKSLLELSMQMGVEDKIDFHGPVTQSELPKLLNKAKIFVTASKTGSLDKVILEAMACGLPAVSLSSNIDSLPPSVVQATSFEIFFKAVNSLMGSKDKNWDDCVSYVGENHSLKNLIKKITNSYGGVH